MKLLKNSPTLLADLRRTRASDNQLHKDPLRPLCSNPVALTGIIMGGRIGLIPKELNVKDGEGRYTAARELAGIRRSNSLPASAEQN
jgi:hypothetical protein